MPVGSSRQEKIRTKTGGMIDMLQAFFGYFSVGTSKYRRDLRLGGKKNRSKVPKVLQMVGKRFKAPLPQIKSPNPHIQ